MRGNTVLSEDEQEGFVYASFTNDKGRKTVGWLLKADLSKQ